MSAKKSSDNCFVWHRDIWLFQWLKPIFQVYLQSSKFMFISLLIAIAVRFFYIVGESRFVRWVALICGFGWLIYEMIKELEVFDLFDEENKGVE